MNLTDIREGELKPVFEALEKAFHATDTDYYIIGALARDIWFARGQKRFRATRDVDFAVLVGTTQAYEELRHYLQTHYGYAPSSTNDFVLHTPEGIAIDLLPFGAIAIDDRTAIESLGLASIPVNGLGEVYDSGTKPVELASGQKPDKINLARLMQWC